jgi:hypothetical protein
MSRDVFISQSLKLSTLNFRLWSRAGLPLWFTEFPIDGICYCKTIIRNATILIVFSLFSEKKGILISPHSSDHCVRTATIRSTLSLHYLKRQVLGGQLPNESTAVLS